MKIKNLNGFLALFSFEVFAGFSLFGDLFRAAGMEDFFRKEIRKMRGGIKSIRVRLKNGPESYREDYIPKLYCEIKE